MRMGDPGPAGYSNRASYEPQNDIDRKHGRDEILVTETKHFSTNAQLLTEEEVLLRSRRGIHIGIGLCCCLSRTECDIDISTF